MADQEKKVILTREGYEKLEKELDYYISVRRNEISEQIAIARGFGDLSENAEYDEAKNEQSRIEAKIVEMENTLRNCVVVEDDEVSTDVSRHCIRVDGLHATGMRTRDSRSGYAIESSGSRASMFLMLFSQLIRRDGEGAVFADNRSLAFEREHVLEDELYSLTRSRLDWQYRL